MQALLAGRYRIAWGLAVLLHARGAARRRAV
jgi:hypothetical protein